MSEEEPTHKALTLSTAEAGRILLSKVFIDWLFITLLGSHIIHLRSRTSPR
jgi:hypothetical protein